MDAEAITERPLPTVRAVTDNLGRFDFSGPDMTDLAFDGLPERRAAVLVAIAAGHGPDRVKTLQPKATAWELKLVRDVPIHGRLVDQNGQPLAGVTVKVTNLSVPNQNSLETYLNRPPAGFLADGYRHQTSSKGSGTFE
jgi:hypothetical protein